jgi:hypothetical protein
MTDKARDEVLVSYNSVMAAAWRLGSRGIAIRDEMSTLPKYEEFNRAAAQFVESLAAALSAAREEERKRWEDHAKSYFDGWEDGEGFPLADTFIAALSPEGSTEGGE